MRTNFEYIEKEANAALERETKTPNLPATVREGASKAGLKVIAGLAVYDQSAALKVHNHTLRERRSAIDAYWDDRDRAAAKLKKLGIAPLAILPKRAWELICAESGLYRLSPDKDGQVPVNGQNRLDAFGRQAVVLGVFAWLGLLVCLTYVFASHRYYHPWPHDGSAAMQAADMVVWTVLLLGVGVYCFFFGLVMRFAPYIWSHNVITRLLIALYRFRPHVKLLRDYFPGGVSPADSNMRATLVLPQPPQDVADTLVRAESLELKVAAVGDAIAFVETPSQVLSREHKRRVELRRSEREESSKLDPIIYHEHGSAVAIIAQFGEFPVEQSVVYEILKSGHLF